MTANKSNIFSCSDNLNNNKTLTQYKNTCYYVCLSAASQQAEINKNSLVRSEPSVAIPAIFQASDQQNYLLLIIEANKLHYFPTLFW